jgi:hypothetical protein
VERHGIGTGVADPETAGVVAVGLEGEAAGVEALIGDADPARATGELEPLGLGADERGVGGDVEGAAGVAVADGDPGGTDAAGS